MTLRVLLQDIRYLIVDYFRQKRVERRDRAWRKEHPGVDLKYVYPPIIITGASPKEET